MSDHDDETVTEDAGKPLGAGQRAVHPVPLPGETLGGRFFLKELIGRGGTGTVYSALDTHVGQKVAIKVLHPERTDELNHERLRREVRAAKSGHENVINVFDLHTHDGYSYLSMELVPGRSLRQILDEKRRLGVDETVALGLDAAHALAHLHDNGLVHRDLKPGNLLVTPDGSVKLCDLGLARPLARGSTVTETAMVVGTPTYMAPEQATATELTAATDIYALGLTLYKCLTGEVPLEGDTAVETLMRRQQAIPPRIGKRVEGCPKWLDRLLRWMLESNPSERPTAAQVVDTLTGGRMPRVVNRRTLRKATVAALVLIVATAFALFIRNRVSDSALDPTAGLVYRSQAFDDGTAVEILDDRGNRLYRFQLDINWEPRRWARKLRRVVDFGDLDGDGLEDAVIARPVAALERPIEILIRQPDGTLRLEGSYPATARFNYEGNEYLRFQIVDVHCNDLDGDGRAEIVVVENSAGFYPATVRIVNIDNDALFQIWHPGGLSNARTADRDGDGRMELYVGGTCNFLTPPESNTSDPVLMVFEVDWEQPDLRVSLFGPGRQLEAAMPKGVRMLYATWPSVPLRGSLSPWQFASVLISDSNDPTTYIDVMISQISATHLGSQSDTKTFVRSAYFNRDLELTLYQWNPLVTESLGIDPNSPEMQALLRPSFWAGSGWQPESCFVTPAGD